MSIWSAKCISAGGKLLAAMAAIVLLGKPQQAMADTAQSDNTNSLELDSSASVFEPILMCDEEDPDCKPPSPE